MNEHIHAEAQSNLIGEGVARYFIWDAKRSLDYLASRPDVDPTRIGAAGCSGGGALTTFIGALDSRLKAVIPACFPNSYRLLFTGSDPGSEMSFPDLLAQGLDTADFVELSARRRGSSRPPSKTTSRLPAPGSFMRKHGAGTVFTTRTIRSGSS